MADRRKKATTFRTKRMLVAATPLPNITVIGYYMPERKQLVLSSEQFCAQEMLETLRSCAASLVEDGGPILRDHLEKHVISLFGLSKRGRFIAAQLETVFSVFPAVTTEQQGNDGKTQIVYWPSTYAQTQTSAGKDFGYLYCRCSAEDAPDKRYTYDLPLIEVANAMAASVKEGEAVGRDELFTRAARLMGYTRIGASLRPVLERSLILARELGYFL
ncbi:hypothetical protein [Parasphaerochaeta coccoides]|uniref:hypothetical protein n=1 Tax=Parasphaerochaeta coccoides TaxID=273376 RepID=UPI0003068D08|nr:hypothetical protein [Parasphaerochaeta coccoides]